MTNLEIVTSKDHTLSCLSIGSFLLRMSAFLYLTNRMKNSFGEMKMIFLGNGDEQSWRSEIFPHLHDKDTTSKTSITKWYFSAMGMNNLDIPKYHAPNTQKRYNFWIKHQKMIFCGKGDEQSLHSEISYDKDSTFKTSNRKWYFAARGMNNLYIPKYHTTKIQLLKQASEDVIFGNEDEQSYVPKYHASNARQSGWTIQTFGVYYPLQKEKKQFCCSTMNTW